MEKQLQPLVAKILSDQKLDPTIINGGVINSFNSNAKLPKGNGQFWKLMSQMEAFEITN